MNSKIKIIVPVTFAAIIVVATAIYIRGVSTPFQFDDERDIVYRPEVAQGALEAAKSSPFRALTYATYSLDYKIGGRASKQFHVTNILLHILASGLLYLFIRKKINPQNLPEEIAASVGAIAFAAHPLCSASVAYISGRAGLISAVGGFGMLWVWERGKFKGRWLALTLLEAFALTGKEDAVIFPVLLAAFCLIERRSDYKELVEPFIVAIVYGVMRVFFHPVIMGANVSLASHLLIQPYAYFKLLAEFFLPVGLSLDHQPAPISGIGDMRLLAPAVIVIFLIASAIYAARKGKTTIADVVAWTFIALAPTVVTPLADPIAENRWYFALAGLSLLTTYVFRYIMNNSRVIFVVSVVVYLICMFALARNRTAVLSNTSTIWIESAKLYPDSPRGWSNYAQARLRDGFPIAAGIAAQRALKLDPKDPVTWNTLGLSFKNTGQLDKALEAFRKAALIHPDLFISYLNMGNIYAAKGKFDEAENEYRTALKLAPDDPNTNFVLAWVLAHTGRAEEAIKYLDVVLKYNPNDAEARKLMERISGGNQP